MILSRLFHQCTQALGCRLRPLLVSPSTIVTVLVRHGGPFRMKAAAWSPLVLAWIAAAPHVVAGQSLDNYGIGNRDREVWKLPNQLREISGLAMTADDRLFAHNDEAAIVYELDYRGGRIVKAFALGDIIVRDDLEGIARVDDRFFLVSSTGRLYEGREGADDERVLYNSYGTGVGRNCEVEGLAFEPADRVLLLLCKTPRTTALKGRVTIYRWSVESRALAPGPPLSIPADRFTTPLDEKSFSPSGIERHPQTGNYFIVAARERAIAEITPRGEVLEVMPLPRGRHGQVEGITFASDLTMFLADEGGRRRARLTAYQTSAGR